MGLGEVTYNGLEPADPPKSFTKEELIKDEWVKWILADSQYCTDRE